MDLTLSGGGQALAIGDVDGDRNLDSVTPSSSPASLDVLFGKGDGTFPSRVGYYAVKPDSLALGDLNGDGRRDMVLVDRTSSSLSVLLNKCQ